MTRKKWTLLVIAAAGGRPVSPVQLQKSLFLLHQNLPDRLGVDRFYDFEPYDYGPFDGDIYTDAEALQEEGLVTIDVPLGQRYREYYATPVGLELSGTLRTKLDPAVREYLDSLVRWVRSLSFNALVQAVYSKYPEMAVNSVFRRPE